MITELEEAWLPRVRNEGYQSFLAADYIARAEGCHVWDAEGRKYIDMTMGCGSMILGHAHPVVVEAVREQIALGSIFSAPHVRVHEMGKLLAVCMPWFDGFVFCNSGSEAVMRLARIARSVTGKRKIGLFSGCWHGSWDGTLVEEEYADRAGLEGRPIMRPKSSGSLNAELFDSIVFLPHRDSAAFDLIRENASQLACVLIEPVQGSNPSGDATLFLADLQNVCRDSGALLAFDEVVTGFRLAAGGGQAHFGVYGDLAAYGKILGGGLPVGAVAGTKAVMDEARRKGVFFGGTFSANPLTIAAGVAALRYLERHPETYHHLAYTGSLLRSAVNQYCRERDLPAHMMGAGSISRLILAKDPIDSRRERDLKEPGAEAQQRFYAGVKARGVWIGANRIQLSSTAHGLSEIGRVAEALCESLAGFEWWEGH